MRIQYPRRLPSGTDRVDQRPTPPTERDSLVRLRFAPPQRGFFWTLAAGIRTLRLEPTEAASDASHQTYCHAKAITITSTAINKPSCAQKLSAKLRPFVLSLWIVMGDDLPLGRHLEMVASKQMLMNGKER